MKQLHPALVLFKRLFDKAALDPGPVLPTYFVARTTFHHECRRAGLDCPENWIEAIRWEESIGLTDYAHKIIAKYHREHGSDFTPMEKGAWRLHRQQARRAAREG